jgi:protein kinase-like protein
MEEIFVGGRYTLRGLLGSGGMAEVFVARDDALGRDVALKILKEQYAEDEGFVELFRREAQGAAFLNHPNVVIVYDWGRSEDETYYMAMEYVPRGTLKDRINTEGFLDPYTAIELTICIAQGLGFAHERKVIHRDVKSQNILLTEAGTAKVADFGIARAAAATTTSRSNPILGSAGYMSPERIQGGPVGPWSDLYSLGVVLYEMLTGELPYGAQDQVALATKHVNVPPRSPREANPEVPEVLDVLTLRLLAKDPSDRYGSATELLEDLRRVRDGLPLASAHSEPLAAKQSICATTPGLMNSHGNGMNGGQYVVYGGRANKIPLALAGTCVALLILLGVAVWGPWWGPQELARAQDVAGGSLDGPVEAFDADERMASTTEDERGDGSKGGSEAASLPKNQGQRNSEASTGSPTLGNPNLPSGTAVLEGSAVGQYSEPDSETNGVPGIRPEQVGVLEIKEGSTQEASQEHLGAEHVGEGAANGRSSEPTGTVIGTRPAVASPAERETSVTNEGGSGTTSQDDGEAEEALHAEGPVVYEAIADPEVAPDIRLGQAKTMAQALAKGDPHTVRIVKQLLKGKLQEFHDSLAKADSRSGSVYTD